MVTRRRWGSMSRFKLLMLMTLPRGASSANCLPDAIPESARKYIQDGEGKDIAVGVFPCNWASSFLVNTMTVIWIQEVLGYHSHIHPQAGATGASAIWALAGCTNFDDAATRSCGENETLIHVSTDTWVGSYAATEEAFAKENPQIAAVDLGAMGYSGEESIYLAQATMDLGQVDSGLALDFYKSYNTSRHNPKKYFDSLSDVDPSELALCSDTDFSNRQRMNAYARFSGDYDGMVQQSDGSYIAKCPDGRWWPAPACRSDLTKCIPTFTASPGWKLQAMMQWTAAYGFPAAIAISNVWGNFEKHVRSFRALHYWWVPDSTFVEMLPQPVVFPRHIASEWAEGNKKTGGAGSYVSKMVSYNLQSKARLVQEFVGKISLELPDVQDMLLTHKQSGARITSTWPVILSKRSGAKRTIGPPGSPIRPNALRNSVCTTNRPSNSCRIAMIPRTSFASHVLLDTTPRSLKMGDLTGCPVGTSQPSGASLACDPCPKGEYQDEEATSSCKRCEVGKYQSELGQTDCRSCPRKTTTLGFGSKSLSDCGCEEGRINIGPEIRQNGSDFECVGCDDGLYCPFSSTLQNLRDGESQLGKDYVPKVLTGYYTPVEDPLSVYRCEPAHVCPKGPPGLCLGGLQGNPCAICPDGQFFTDNRCKECGAVNVLWPIGIVAGLSGFFLFYYIGNAKASAQACPIKVSTMAAGIALNVMQTIALMGMMTVEWPAEMENTSSGLQFMVLDVQMAGGQCFMGSDATGRYTVTCLLFPVIVLWMLCCSLMTRRFVQCAPFSRFESYAWTWPRTFNIIGLLLQVGFSTASAVVMQPLMCYRHPNGMRSLLKYPNVMCGESEQGALLAVGMVTGSLFIGAFYSGCVVAALKIPSWSLQGKNDLVMCFRFLTSNFRLNRWWFGLLVMARGFGFGLIIAIATDTPAAQTSLATLILVVYGFLQAVMWPWKAQLINVADVLLSSLMLLLVGRTKMKEVVVASNHNGWNFSRIFTLMLLIAIAITITLMVAASLCAILLHLFGSTQGEEKKRQTGRFLNLNNLPFLDKVAMALQDIGEAMRGSDVNELIENLAEINHYDLKVILDAMQIITTEVMHMTSVGHRQSVQSLNSFAVSRRVISENGLSKMRSNLNDTCESRPKDRGSQRSIASSRTSQNTLGTHMSVADSDMPKKNDDQTDEKSNAPAESASSPAEGSSAVVEAEYNVAELESVGISLPAQGRVVAENL